MTPLALLDRAETATARAAGAVIFATVDLVQAVPRLFGSWEVALREQRKGVGEHRERHLERASRLREIGWAERVEQQRPSAAEREVA